MMSATCAKLYNPLLYNTQIYKYNEKFTPHSYKSAHREGKYSEIAKGGKNIKRECEALTRKNQEPPPSVVKYHSKES